MLIAFSSREALKTQALKTVKLQSGKKNSTSLQRRYNERDCVSNHLRLDCFFNRLSRRRSKKTSKLRVIGLCEGNPPVTGDSSHKGPVTRKIFPFDDVIMCRLARGIPTSCDVMIKCIWEKTPSALLQNAWWFYCGPNETVQRLSIKTNGTARWAAGCIVTRTIKQSTEWLFLSKRKPTIYT